MPEFILPEEADHCPHCGQVLLDPPNCCPAMEQEHSDDMHRRYGPLTGYDEFQDDEAATERARGKDWQYDPEEGD